MMTLLICRATASLRLPEMRARDRADTKGGKRRRRRVALGGGGLIHACGIANSLPEEKEVEREGHSELESR